MKMNVDIEYMAKQSPLWKGDLGVCLLLLFDTPRPSGTSLKRGINLEDSFAGQEFCAPDIRRERTPDNSIELCQVTPSTLSRPRPDPTLPGVFLTSPKLQGIRFMAMRGDPLSLRSSG